MSEFANEVVRLRRMMRQAVVQIDDDEANIARVTLVDALQRDYPWWRQR